jgi:hypothetical protein
VSIPDWICDRSIPSSFEVASKARQPAHVQQALILVHIEYFM